MTLKIIGAGFPRTGTLSLKQALEQLGFLKCHHMVEVLEHLDQARMFFDAVDGPANWDNIYQGYEAGVDWPTCYFWRELVDYYPQAKVILSLRDPEEWFKSFSSTVLRDMKSPLAESEAGLALQPLAREIAGGVFDGNLEGKDHILRVYEAHNRRVKETVPAARLLVYKPGDGWEPLCKFLDRPVPGTPYPHTNTTKGFHTRMAHLRESA